MPPHMPPGVVLGLPLKSTVCDMLPVSGALVALFDVSLDVPQASGQQGEEDSGGAGGRGGGLVVRAEVQEGGAGECCQGVLMSNADEY